MQTQKKTTPKRNKAGHTYPEYLLHTKFTGLIQQEEFAYNSAGSILSFMERGHENLHPGDYEALFKLLDLLNSMQYTRVTQLLDELESKYGATAK